MDENLMGKQKGGWRTLGVWVTLAFVVVIVAWFFLIRVASENAMEPVPLKQTK